MLNKSKGKKHRGHTGVVVSYEEIIKIGLKKGREPLRLSELTDARGGSSGHRPCTPPSVPLTDIANQSWQSFRVNSEEVLRILPSMILAATAN